MEHKEEVLTECPCCKENTFKLPLKPKDEDLQLYMACIISGQPFKKTYSLWDGRIRVEAVEMSQKKLIELQKVATKLAFADRGQFTDILKLISDILYNKAHVSKISIYKDGQVQKTYQIQPLWYKSIEETLKAQNTQQLQKVLKVLTDTQKVGAVSMSLIQKVVRTHNNIVQLLALSGFDSDFFGDLLLD